MSTALLDLPDFLNDSDFTPPFWLRNPHLQTIVGRRQRGFPCYERTVIDTPDGDFLDLDWLRRAGRTRLVVLSHGLEGSSRSFYMCGMAQMLDEAGWDILAWNMRGCGGRPNRRVHSYHSGFTDDLATVLTSVERSARYTTIVLIGFSVGGNITLKYLGELGSSVSSTIAAALTFSVPCDLADAARTLQHPSRRVYLSHFLRILKGKISEKHKLYPQQIDMSRLERIKTFEEYDDQFTVPHFGYSCAQSYYRDASSKPHIPQITIPTLIMNAQDDPFFTKQSIPNDEVRGHKFVNLLVPRYGGHVGFQYWRGGMRSWIETITLQSLDRWFRPKLTLVER